MKQSSSEKSTGVQISENADCRPEGESSAEDTRRVTVADIACIACVSALLFFSGLWTYPAIEPAEAYYVEAAREMVEIGSYIVPILNYQIYFSKPILTFWLITGSYNLFGISELAARLPFALLSVLLSIATYFTATRLYSRRAGLVSAICLVTAPHVLFVARTSPIDIAFTTFVNIAVMATALTMFSSSKRWWPVIYIGLALSVLTKGPAGIVLYLLGIATFLVVRRASPAQILQWLKDVRLGLGLPLFLIIILPWHYMVSQDTEGLFLKVFILYENYARALGHTNLVRTSWWFYFPIVMVGFLPWTLMIIPALRQAFTGPGDNQPGSSASNPVGKLVSWWKQQASPNRDAKRLSLMLLALWSLSVIVFFSISKTKLQTYILPMYAPMAIVVGATLDAWLKNDEQSEGLIPKWLKILGGVVGLMGILTAIALVGAAYWSKPELISVILMVASAGLIAIVALLSLGVANLALRYRFWSQIAATVLISASLISFGFQIAGQHFVGDLRKLALTTRDLDSIKLLIFADFCPSLMFYSKRPVTSFYSADQLVALNDKEQGEHPRKFMFVHEKKLKTLQSNPNLDLKLYKKEGKWSLYEVIGMKLTPIPTLTEIFSDPAAFNEIISGRAVSGPFTVPYTAGNCEGGYKRPSER